MSTVRFQLPDTTVVQLDADLVGSSTVVGYTLADGTLTYAHRLARNGRRFTAAQMAKRERVEQAQEVFRGHVSRGVCPRCGAKLRRNLSIAGWWQCEQLGAVGVRRDATRTSCAFQGFTEEV